MRNHFPNKISYTNRSAKTCRKTQCNSVTIFLYYSVVRKSKFNHGVSQSCTQRSAEVVRV